MVQNSGYEPMRSYGLQKTVKGRVLQVRVKSVAKGFAEIANVSAVQFQSCI